MASLVDMYDEYGHFRETVKFKYKWQARLFHLLTNKSTSHMGRRNY